MATHLPLEPILYRKGAHAIRALNHKLRQQMLKLIHEKKSTTVTEIYVKLMLDQSTVSQHLRILREANIVLTQRKGKEIYYSVNYQRIVDVNIIIAELILK
jgi:DNA-binding transcriptional ArsR family regulator